MTYHETIRPPDLPDVEGQAIDITTFMVSNGILRIGRFDDNFNVYVTGDKMGCGKSFDEAFDNARGVS